MLWFWLEPLTLRIFRINLEVFHIDYFIVVHINSEFSCVVSFISSQGSDTKQTQSHETFAASPERCKQARKNPRTRFYYKPTILPRVWCMHSCPRNMNILITYHTNGA